VADPKEGHLLPGRESLDVPGSRCTLEVEDLASQDDGDQAGRTQCNSRRRCNIVGEWIQPLTERTEEEIIQYQFDLEEMATEAVRWSVDGEWLVELPRELPTRQLAWTKEDERFWSTYLWSENPWLVYKECRMLLTQKFNRIQSCTIEDLNITSIVDTTYYFPIPEGKEK
jgi:hypothetical protein